MKDSNTPLDVVLMKMELKLSLPSPAPPPMGGSGNWIWGQQFVFHPQLFRLPPSRWKESTDDSRLFISPFIIPDFCQLGKLGWFLGHVPLCPSPIVDQPLPSLSPPHLAPPLVNQSVMSPKASEGHGKTLLLCLTEKILLQTHQYIWQSPSESSLSTAPETGLHKHSSRPYRPMHCSHGVRTMSIICKANELQ